MATSLLTPSKIALAFLIRFYCNGFVPPELELPILQLLISHIDLDVARKSTRQPRLRNEHDHHLTITGKDAETLRSAFKAQNVTPKNVKVKEPDVWVAYEAQLCSVRSLDSLLDEIKQLKNLYSSKDTEESQSGNLAPDAAQNTRSPSSNGETLVGIHRTTKLTKWSLYGVFIRRVLLEFEKLSFDDAMRMWRGFKAYRQPLMDSLGVPNESEEFGFMDEQSGGRISTIISDFLLDARGDSRETSSVDIEKILEFQINQMQKNGSKLPPETRSQIEDIIKSTTKDSNLSNYMNFLQAWYKGDQTSSFDYLHRYYDYAMQHTDRFHYQYALLNMAILQADFGSFDEAAAAMKEAIGTARENKDIHCLNYCLSWLYHFCAQHAERASEMVQKVLQAADGDQGIRYLKAAARDFDMHGVETQIVLLEAGKSLAKGHRPLEALERLYEASYLILNHHLEGVKASQILFHSSVYTRLGIPSLSKSLNNLIPECYASHASQEEIIQARCRNAYFDALAGKFNAEQEILDNLRKSDLNIKLDQLLAQYSGVIKLKRTLNQFVKTSQSYVIFYSPRTNHADSRELAEAERLIAALKSGASLNADLAFVVSLSEIELQMHHGNLSDALSRVEALFQKYEDQSQTDTYQRMKLLNMKAFIFARAGKAQKGLSIAMRSATAAYRAKNAMVLWESVAALAGVLVAMKEWDAAAAITGSAVYRASEVEDVAVVALLRKIGIDALVGQAGAAGNEEDRQKLMKLALEWIKAAGDLYRQLEDYAGQCEMNVKARTVLNYLGDVSAAKALEGEYGEVKALIGT